MAAPRNVIIALGAWQLSGLLFLLYVASEWLTHRIGGDQGALLYVTVHFIVMPLLSLLVIVMIGIRALRAPSTSKKIIALTAMVIPCAIIAIAVSGRPGISFIFGKF